MSDPAPTPRPAPSRWHYLTAVLCVVFVGAVLITLLRPLYAAGRERAAQQKAISNCRQIITTCRLYSNDAREIFPDHKDPPGITPKTANEAFRELFKMGACDSEEIFGCPNSPFVPDGKIGHAPDWSEALQKGENHWAMTAGLSDADVGYYPLIYENPVYGEGPPCWNADAAGQKKPGRCWRDGKVVVGFVDSSVALLKVEAKAGPKVKLMPAGGFDPDRIFSPGGGPGKEDLHILQVEQ